MREAVNECFFPNGILAMKYFGAPNPRPGFNRYAKGHDLEILSLVRERLDDGSPVDEALAKKIWELIKD